MMSLFLAIHAHAAKRGDGLRPEFLGLMPQPRDMPKAVNENPAGPAGQPKGVLKGDPQPGKTVRRPVIV
ncbi:hypothetical protein FJW07_22945 [Mesorhizobium sp. B3-1-9]|uniref:hypothetical protein n=1 Tax=Mesorhizobium sp. B3-1-9 TaxID=2589892 RepID=UPI00112E6ACF|nr:hypothetical protein [Mesorhizobium sp. B3-1-9]TPI35697.1 hypothetical protein FJW07_22945 [Mesorhizobium sp. B3-1-9]